MKRNVLNSPRLLELKKRRHRAILNKILISFFGLVVIFVSLSYLSRLSSLNIHDVEVVGNKVVDTQDIKDIVNTELASKYLWLFPKTNIFLYPKSVINKILATDFKRLKDINLSVQGKVLQVSVAERIGLYTWCGDALPPLLDQEGAGVRSETCYFVDKDGFVFDEAPFFSGAVYFKFYGPLNNFSNLITFKNTLENMGLKPISLETTSDGDINVYLANGSSSSNPKIMLKADADFNNVAENLQAALNTEPLKTNFKNKYSSLQYIDLRFGNKVYDKFSIVNSTSTMIQ